MTEDLPQEQKQPFAWKAAKLSLFIPLVVFIVGLFMRLSVPKPQSKEFYLIVAVVQMVLIIVALVLGVVSLTGIPKYGREGILGYACGGIAVNVLIIVGGIFAFIALVRVVTALDGGYSKDEMVAMSRVIPDSHVIINEELGFRIEIPNGFTDNQQPQPANVMYSFVGILEDGGNIAISIDRLGGRIKKETIASEALKIIRAQLPPDSTVEYATTVWGTHELDMFISHFPIDDLQICSHSVQVPLSREAIQIDIAGVEELSDQCQAVLEQILPSLKGKSNWMEN